MRLILAGEKLCEDDVDARHLSKEDQDALIYVWMMGRITPTQRSIEWTQLNDKQIGRWRDDVDVDYVEPSL